MEQYQFTKNKHKKVKAVFTLAQLIRKINNTYQSSSIFVQRTHSFIYSKNNPHYIDTTFIQYGLICDWYNHT